MTTHPCENCGTDIELTADGHANDVRDYVWIDSPDDRDHVYVCAGCRVRVGIDE